MNESSPVIVAGIDVGKSRLDVHLPDGVVDRVFRNDKWGRRAVRDWLLRHGVPPAPASSPPGATFATSTSAALPPALRLSWSVHCARGASPHVP